MQYHFFINEGAFEELGKLFTEDAVVDFGSVGGANGRPAVAQLLMRIPDKLRMVKQFTHNHMVDIDGDRASGLSYVDARYAQGDESVIVAARFSEEYRRATGQWLISLLNVEIFFAVPLSKGWAGEETNFTQPLE
jgi:hypothetical protein